jgi:hypothetical protein
VSEQFIFRSWAYCKVPEVAEAQNFVLFRKILALKNLRESTLLTPAPGTCIQEVAVLYFEIGHDYTTGLLQFEH